MEQSSRSILYLIFHLYIMTSCAYCLLINSPVSLVHEDLNVDVENNCADVSVEEFIEMNDSPLNVPFTENEIITCIKSLKYNKACGYDQILNEYIKHSSVIMCKMYVKFLNLIFYTGVIPDEWTIGVIKPLYKR